MRHSYFVCILFLFYGCRQKDSYLHVPAETDGLRLLTLDSGISLASTFRKDTFNHIDSSQICMVKEDQDRIQSYKVYVIKYKGIQIERGNKRFFYSIPGAFNINIFSNDTNLRIVNSYIGTAILEVSDPERITLLSFEKNPNAGFVDPPNCLITKIREVESSFPTLATHYKYYIECPNDASKLIFGWEIGKLKKPKCYAHN